MEMPFDVGGYKRRGESLSITRSVVSDVTSMSSDDLYRYMTFSAIPLFGFMTFATGGKPKDVSLDRSPRPQPYLPYPPHSPDLSWSDSVRWKVFDEQ